MDTRQYLTLLWLYVFLCGPALGFECPYKVVSIVPTNWVYMTRSDEMLKPLESGLKTATECFCGGQGITILCVNRVPQLKSVPQIVSNNTAGLTSLMLDMNQITTIPAGSLPSNLTEISLTDNPITTIDTDAFDGSSNTLKLLVFWNARFTQIPDAVIHLIVLKTLSIDDTILLNWDEEVMQHLGATLETLYLKNAGTIASPSWLQYFSQLTELTLDGCFVSDLPDNALNLVVDSLTTLSLFNNSLTVVPKALFGLNVLAKLNLGNNQTANITFLPQSNLSSLTLNNNNISDANLLSNKLRPSADSLRTLTLQVNQLTAIPELGFLSQVVELDLTYNRISDPYSGSVASQVFLLDLGYNFIPAIPRVMSNLSHLNDLTLTANAITQIKGLDFPPNVIWVYLGYNLITELTDTSFPLNSTIRYLHLHNNPISKISDLSFRNLPRLETLILRETKITRLPLALTSVTSLIHFDASDITDLVCTCAEKSLGPRFVNQLPGDVVGDCGETSIYNFFANFSSACPTQ